jgi:hypothetical protein
MTDWQFWQAPEWISHGDQVVINAALLNCLITGNVSK